MGLFSFQTKTEMCPSVFSAIMLRVMATVAALCLGGRALGLSTSRDSGYGPPEQSYQQPSYDGSSVGYEATAAGGSDITPILIGVLVLTGLALLFPSYVTLTSVRRKRSSEGNQGKISRTQYFSRHDIQVRPGRPGGRSCCRGHWQPLSQLAV